MRRFFAKPWRFVAAILLGFSLGFGSGAFFYSKYLDKPEVVNQNQIKQKIKGTNNHAGQTYESTQKIEVENTKKGRTKNKRNRERQTL